MIFWIALATILPGKYPKISEKNKQTKNYLIVCHKTPEGKRTEESKLSKIKFYLFYCC